MTPEQALEVLYSTTRRMTAPADTHDACRQAATVLNQALQELASLKGGQKQIPPTEPPQTPEDVPPVTH